MRTHAWGLGTEGTAGPALSNTHSLLPDTTVLTQCLLPHLTDSVTSCGGTVSSSLPQPTHPASSCTLYSFSHCQAMVPCSAWHTYISLFSLGLDAFLAHLPPSSSHIPSFSDPSHLPFSSLSLNPTAPLNTSSLSQHPHSPHTPSQSWKLDSIPIERHTILRGLVADPG